MKNKLFFENQESPKHHAAKIKLFDLLIQKEVEIVDDLGNNYSVFTKEQNGEFLHVESFTLKPPQENKYMNSVFYSNENLPCVNYFRFDLDIKDNDHKLLCDLRGSCGAIENIPCRKCLEINLTDKQKMNTRIGFTPDISFGYDGKHSIWFEVFKTSPCSDYKIKYCQDNNITLLEIDIESIDEFKEGKLTFSNLSARQFSDGTESFYDSTIKKIKECHYVEKVKFKEDLRLVSPPLSTTEFNQKYDKFLLDNEYIELSYYDEKIKSCMGMNDIEGRKHLIVDDEFMKKMNQCLKNNKLNNTQ